MELELIRNMESPAWTFLAALVLMVAAAAAMMVTASYIKSRKAAVPLVVLIAVVMIGPGIWFADHEENRTDGVKAAVSDGFDRDYGLSISERDLRHLRNVGGADVTRNVETVSGDLKQVLFRAEDGLVLPYTLDSEGTWSPMPAKKVKP